MDARGEVNADLVGMDVLVVLLHLMGDILLCVKCFVVRFYAGVGVEPEGGFEVDAPVVGQIEPVAEGDAYAENFDARTLDGSGIIGVRSYGGVALFVAFEP